MSAKRPSTADYLSFLGPRPTAAPKAKSASKRTPARAARPERETPATEGEGEAEERRGERVSFYLAPEVVAELRGVADALSGPPHFANVSAVTESALRHELDRLRKLYNGGAPFKPAPARDRRRRARLD
jgi:hypothetical protein